MIIQPIHTISSSDGKALTESQPIIPVEDSTDVEEDSKDTQDVDDSQEDANEENMEEDLDEDDVDFDDYVSIDSENISDENYEDEQALFDEQESDSDTSS